MVYNYLIYIKQTQGGTSMVYIKYVLFVIVIILALRLLYELLPNDHPIKDFYENILINIVNYCTLIIGYIFFGRIMLTIMIDDIKDNKTKKQIKSHILDTANTCIADIIRNSSTPQEFKSILQTINKKAKKINTRKYHQIKINKVIDEFFAE